MSGKDKDRQIIGINLKFLRRRKSLTQQELADALEIRRSSIGAYEECRATPKYETLQRMSDFFGVSIDLMVKEDIATLDPGDLIDNREQRLLDLEGKKLRVLQVSVDSDERAMIDFVQEKAAAGYLNGYADPEYIEELPKFRIDIPAMRNGTFRAFEIKGDSMLPLKSGTVILGEYIQNWRRDIKNGETYILVTKDDGIVYKRVFNQIEGEGGELLLHSDNTTHQPYTINVEDIREVWKAKMFLSTDFPDPDITIEKLASLVMDLQREVMKLKNK
ncbi:MAG: XRE family transcriptional regulator [Bacteroidia bacterium]